MYKYLKSEKYQLFSIQSESKNTRKQGLIFPILLSLEERYLLGFIEHNHFINFDEVFKEKRPKEVHMLPKGYKPKAPTQNSVPRCLCYFPKNSVYCELPRIPRIYLEGEHHQT